MIIFILKWANLQKIDRNQTKICPGKKFVTNEYPGIYIYIKSFEPFHNTIYTNPNFALLINQAKGFLLILQDLAGTRHGKTWLESPHSVW